ncbi:hypothetical protein IH992_30505 [Candidatus Poribacteria bacterium]|nr:hypothetical protein [Candidatus Poribacteria bacterium]
MAVVILVSGKFESTRFMLYWDEIEVIPLPNPFGVFFRSYSVFYFTLTSPTPKHQRRYRSVRQMVFNISHRRLVTEQVESSLLGSTFVPKPNSGFMPNG